MVLERGGADDVINLWAKIGTAFLFKRCLWAPIRIQALVASAVHSFQTLCSCPELLPPLLSLSL